MKVFFKVLGSIFLILFLAFVSIGIYTGYKAKAYESTAVPFIKKVIPEISSWDVEASKKYMSDELIAATDDEELLKLTKWLSKLGELKSMEEPVFVNVTSSSSTQAGNQTIATFEVISHYENGDALITIKLLEVDEGFKIHNFHLNSGALIQ